jgi:hypothetical protein
MARVKHVIAVLACLGAAALGGAGCGSESGAGGSAPSSGLDSNRDDDTPPSDTDDPPSRPDFDASFPDDASADPTPPDGDECIDKDDPGSTEAVAKALPNIDDDDDSGGTVTGMMHGEVDVDFYKFQGTDSGFGFVNPTVSSGTTGLELCMFVACMSGTMQWKGCSNGGQHKKSDIGNDGCCVATPSSTTLDYDCDGTGSESSNVFIRVKQIGDQCLPYSVDYHF